jgi:hypothetical protein
MGIERSPHLTGRQKRGTVLFMKGIQPKTSENRSTIACQERRSVASS